MLDQKPDFGQKKWAVKQATKKGMSVRSIAEFMGKSKSTIYRWMQKAAEEGLEALKPKSTRPKTIHTIPQEQVNQILEAHKEYGCGAERLAAILGTVSHMTVYRVLVRFGILAKGKLIRRRWRFFERKHPNSMWQIDIKTISQYPPCYTVSILDDHSRFIVRCTYYDHVPTTEDIVALVQEGIKKYGPPREILTDHGAQFYANKGNGVSSFDLWLDENRINHILAGVRKSTTIGKVERWHRSLKDELLSKVKDLEEFKARLDAFIEYYNFKRPHFGYDRIEVEKDVWKRKKFIYLPGERYRTILMERGIIKECLA